MHSRRLSLSTPLNLIYKLPLLAKSTFNLINIFHIECSDSLVYMSRYVSDNVKIDELNLFKRFQVTNLDSKKSHSISSIKLSYALHIEQGISTRNMSIYILFAKILHLNKDVFKAIRNCYLE